MFRKIMCTIVIVIMVSTLTIIYASNSNLINNPSFENVASGIPQGWTQEAYNKDSTATGFKIEEENAHFGKRFVTVSNNIENDSRYVQAVKVKENTNYKLSCWIRTDNVGQQGKGANISIGSHLETSKEMRRTNGKWEYTELYAKTGKGIETINVTVGVGGYGALSTGKASFDDVSVEEVKSIPDGAITADIVKPKDNGNQNSGSGSGNPASGTGNLLWIVIVASVIITGLAFYMVIKPSQKNVEGEDCKEEDEYLAEEIKSDYVEKINKDDEIDNEADK